MKVLVTGGAGYIGSVVAHRLVEAGHHVEVLDDLSTGFRENVPAAATLHQMSVHDGAQVLTPAAQVDAVLHFAAKIEVSESVANPEKYWHHNIEGTLALLRAIRAAGVPRLVFSSTGSMYVGDGTPFDETAEVRPQNPYAATKAAIDLMISGECGASALGAVSLRYFNACGAVHITDADTWLGERHDPESHLIPILLQVAAGHRESFTLYGTDYPTPDGTCIRDYIHVSDLATAHLVALESITPGRHEIFNLGNGRGFSNREVIDAVRRVTGRDFVVATGERRAGDPATIIASSAKARERLGWEPQRTGLDDMIGDAWKFYSHITR